MSSCFLDHNPPDQLSIVALDACAMRAIRRQTSGPVGVPEDRDQLLDELVKPLEASARRIFPLGHGARFDLVKYALSVSLEKLDEHGDRNRSAWIAPEGRCLVDLFT